MLVVPDDLLVEELDESALHRRSITLHRARSGAEAISRSSWWQPDVVLLGSGLWDMTPAALCRMLKWGSSAPRIILITDRLIDELDSGAPRDADGHFAWPITPGTLERAIETLVDQRRFATESLEAKLPAVAFDLSEDEGTDEIAVKITSLRRNSCVIEAGTELEEGRRGTLCLLLPGLTRPLVLNCQVRCLLDDLGRRYSLEFFDIACSDRKVLRSTIEGAEYLQSNGPSPAVLFERSATL